MSNINVKIATYINAVLRICIFVIGLYLVNHKHDLYAYLGMGMFILSFILPFPITEEAYRRCKIKKQ